MIVLSTYYKNRGTERQTHNKSYIMFACYQTASLHYWFNSGSVQHLVNVMEHNVYK